MAAGWISKRARTAIYARDAMTCCYCGKECCAATVANATKEMQAAHMKANYKDIITLDHIVSQKELAEASTNDADFKARRRDAKNIVAVCNACNSSKKDTTLYVWCEKTNKSYAAILTVIAQRISQSI